MWRIAAFIRKNCGERKKSVGHRCSKCTALKILCLRVIVIKKNQFYDETQKRCRLVLRKDWFEIFYFLRDKLRDETKKQILSC